MVTVNNNKPVDMKQLWQQLEPAPTASSALAALTTSEDGQDRYIYYLVSSLFYRYDTWANTWHKLAPPLFVPTVFVSLRFSKYSGQFGRVISTPSGTTVRIAGLNEGVFDGNVIRIISGTGAGQVRTITDTPFPTKYEQGVATVANANQIGDSTKKWKINQWAGYQVRLTFGAGQTQVRKVLYNDATTLTISDTNYQPIDSFNNQGFASAAPFGIPVVTAGAQTHFVIEASDLVLNSAWTVNPDFTSRYKIESGGVWMFTQAAAAPFYNLHYYDVAADQWSIRTASANLVTAAFALDGTIERTGEIGGVYASGTATAGGTYTMTDTSAPPWPVDAYRNYRVRITAGTGVGQSRRITANNATVLEVARKWDINPNATSIYEIIADKDKYYFTGNGQAMLYQYDVDSDLPLQASKVDDGIANNMAVRYAGIEQPTIAVTSGTRSTGGITAVNSVPTAGGANYVVGDVLTVSTGGTNGKVIVESVAPGGAVTGISLFRAGATYTTGTAKATTGGTGTGATIEITSIGTVGLIVTAINHNFVIGDSIIFSGDAAWNSTYTVIGADSLTTLDVAITAAGNAVALSSQSTTVIVDSTKNWTVNEHIGKILQTHLVGVTGAVQPRVILSNTATTITVATIGTALVNGTGRYVITEPSALGRDEEFKNAAQSNSGFATGGSTTTLVDSSKNWFANQHAGSRIRITAGTGRDAYFTVTSNTATTLTYAAQGFTPDTTTRYIVMGAFGTATSGSTTTIVDTTQSWTVNRWAGKRLRIMAGAGHGLVAGGNEVTITSNTANTLTFAAVTGLAPDTTTQYCILGIPVRASAIELLWAYGGSSAGRYMYCARGTGSNTLDRYDITREVWEYSFLMSPQTDTLTSGSYYAYDGGNRIYISPGVGSGLVQYVFYLDLNTNKVCGFGSVPNTQLAQAVGNRMEIIQSPQGIEYLYHMRNTGAEMYRAMVFF